MREGEDENIYINHMLTISDLTQIPIIISYLIQNEYKNETFGKLLTTLGTNFLKNDIISKIYLNIEDFKY